MNKAGMLLIAFFVMLIALAPFLASQISFSKEAGLKNLKRIDAVVTEEVGKVAEEMGLTTDRVRTTVELALRREGFVVPVSPEHKGAAMSVNVHVMKGAFSIQVDVEELVYLERDRSIGCLASTWSNSMLGTHRGQDSDAEFILRGVQQLLDTFFNDYYAANRKNKATTPFQI